MITIKYKNKKVLNGCMKEMHPKLIALWLYVTDLFDHLSEELVVTCGYEDRGPDSTSVHSVVPCRGRDLREWNLEHPQIIEEQINRKWIYDPKRPKLKCARIHKNRSGKGKHLHLQVHPNTRRIA